MSADTRVVASLEEVLQNIRTYNQGVAEYPGLAARIKQHPAWYAVRDEQGSWIFGPSKFVGYHRADAKSYLASYSPRDGKETEPALSAWFEQVDLETQLGRELREAFVRFAEKFGKSPNARWRVSVTDESAASYGLSNRRGRKADNAGRIAHDPRICGGRPHIRGTRIRVHDIVAALAAGDTVEELLEDFPYLAAEDISAALAYAADAVDHRVLVAA